MIDSRNAQLPGVQTAGRPMPVSRYWKPSVPPAWLAGSYLWDAVLGNLHRRAGNLESAQRHRDRALASAPTEAVRDLLRRRLTIAA